VKKVRSNIPLVVVAVLLSGNMAAQSRQVSTIFQWLNLPTDARSAGMAGAETAVDGDVNATVGNPARLLLLPLQHNFSADLINFPQISSEAKKISFRYALKPANSSVFGCSIDYYTNGNIALLNDYGAEIGTIKQYEYAFGLSYGIQLTESSFIGTSLRYNRQSTLGSFLGATSSAGNTVAGDIGYLKDFKLRDQFEKIRFGVAIKNIGSKVNGQYLPTKFNLGLTYTDGHYDDDRFTSFDFAWSGGLQIEKLLVPTLPDVDNSGAIISGKDPNNRSVFGNLISTWTDAPGGFSNNLKQLKYTAYTELLFKKLISFRAGYTYQNPDIGSYQHFALGAGIVWEYENSDYHINLAYLQPVGNAAAYSPLRNVFSLQFIVQFAKNK